METDIKDNWHRLQVTIQKSLEGSCDVEETCYLREIIATDPDARRYYTDYLMIHGSLFQISNKILDRVCGEGVNFDTALLELADYERKAPCIQVSKEEFDPARL